MARPDVRIHAAAGVFCGLSGIKGGPKPPF